MTVLYCDIGEKRLQQVPKGKPPCKRLVSECYVYTSPLINIRRAVPSKTTTVLCRNIWRVRVIRLDTRECTKASSVPPLPLISTTTPSIRHEEAVAKCP